MVQFEKQRLTTHLQRLPSGWALRAELLTYLAPVSLFLTRVIVFNKHEIFSLKYSANVESRTRLFFVHIWKSKLKLIGLSIWY